MEEVLDHPRHKDADSIVTLLDGKSPGFWTALHAMMTTFVTLLTAGFVYETCAAKRRKKRLTSKCSRFHQTGSQASLFFRGKHSFLRGKHSVT